MEVNKVKRLEFYGCSDDTFGEYGVTGQDCDNCGSEKPIQCVVDCGEYGRVMVVGQYSSTAMHNGCWLVGLTKVDEYDDLPDWNFRYEESDCPYSPALLMDLLEGSYDLTWYKDGKKVEKED